MFNTFRIRMLVAGLWVIALAVMWSGYAWLTSRVDVRPQIAAVADAIQIQDWPAATRAVANLQQSWRRARPVVELNFGGALLEEFEAGLARLEGSVAAQSAGLAHVSLAELSVSWQGLRSPYPDGM